MIKCILFDRDGTLGELDDKRFPKTFRPFCDIKEVFSALRQRGYLVGIITNQSSIARGTAIGYDFEKEFSAYGVDGWKICPHDDKDDCDCRKPKSGLLLSIAKQFKLSPDECLVVGDRLSDILCAKNVGAEGALCLTGYGKNELQKTRKHFPNCPVLGRFDEVLTYLENNH